MKLTGDKKYQLLVEISQKIRDTLDLDVINTHILDTIKTVLDYDAGGIFVLNQDLVHHRREQPKEVIAGMTQRGFDPQPVENDEMLTKGKGIVGHVISTGTSLIAPDVRLNPYYVPGRRRTRSEITVPILRNNRAIGALNLESDRLAAFEESDLEVLQFFADAAAIALEKAMLHRKILEKELLDKQLQMARDVQSRLFPESPPRVAGYEIAGICLPAEEIGGDYYDFIRLPRAGMGVAVADVSGNGIAAALVMTSFRGLLRTHTRGKLGLAGIARTINRLLPEFTGNSSYITAVYLVLDAEVHEFTYVCSGHPPPLLIHADGTMQQLEVRGPALGVFRDARYTTETRLLLPGDILALYTDGVVEVANLLGEEFGVERLVNAIDRARGATSEGIIQAVIAETRKFSGSTTYSDDFTLVIVKREAI